MKTRFYSQSTGGFYDSVIHSSIPDDAVEISEEKYTSLMVAQSTGKIISADKKGNPIAINRPEPSDDELWQARKVTAKQALTESDIMVLRCYESDIKVPAAWVNYRNNLRTVLNDIAAPLPIKPTEI